MIYSKPNKTFGVIKNIFIFSMFIIHPILFKFFKLGWAEANGIGCSDDNKNEKNNENAYSSYLKVNRLLLTKCFVNCRWEMLYMAKKLIILSK